MCVTHHLLGFDGLIAAAHADKLASRRVSDDLVDLLVEHVGAAVDGAQTSKGLREFTETVEWVDVGGFAVASHRSSVENDTVDCWASGLGNVAMVHRSVRPMTKTETMNSLVVKMQSHGMTNEVLSTGLKAELLVDRLHGVGVKVDT